jgi:hypothetical protein
MRLSEIPWSEVVGAMASADDALARLDDRLKDSQIRAGWLARSHFTDACAALWHQGELVHVEDLVLHDAGLDVRGASHALTIALGILKARRRIAEAPAGWGVSASGIAALRGSPGSDDRAEPASDPSPLRDTDDDPWTRELLAVDAIIARSSARIVAITPPFQRSELLYEPDGDDRKRLDEWCAMRMQVRSLPPLIGGAYLWDAWRISDPMPRQPWLGSLLVASHLRECGKTRFHLPCLNAAMKHVARDKRHSVSIAVRIRTWLDAVRLGAEQGLAEHARWSAVRAQLNHRIAGHRSTSSMPSLISLVLEHPIVTGPFVAKKLGVSTRAARALVEELGLRETTGRSSYRAWGVL